MYSELDRGNRQPEMSIPEELVDPIERIGSGTHTKADLQKLGQLFGAAVATGKRSLAINRDASGATIATGDGNTILNIILQAEGLQIEENVYRGDGTEGLKSILWEIEIFQHLNSSDLSLDRISQFQQGVEALDNLQVRLMSLVMIHAIERVTVGKTTEKDLQLLRNTISTKTAQDVVQVGKYNIHN